ncbi:MAG: oxidoreductase family protein [Pirellulaceae bacterium]
MDESLRRLICDSTGADNVGDFEVIQTLWSGYGQILRVPLLDTDVPSVIVKHVTPPDQVDHPRGWSTDLSHQRKLRSYQVESCWYQDWSHRCSDACRVPRCLCVDESDGRSVFVLEDLDAVGFPVRRSGLRIDEVKFCLQWLAEFHATFLGETPQGLWPVGTYWHLGTRPGEWDVMEAGPLKDAANAIDAKLSACPYQTLVHGDAKVANFCFSNDRKRVAAVDFQYVGGGCGMKDVVYFLGSCLSDDECERYESELLTHFFGCLADAINRHGRPLDVADVEASWRSLYPFAWADFNRFLAGWCPGHYKLTARSQKITQQVIDLLR